MLQVYIQNKPNRKQETPNRKCYLLKYFFFFFTAPKTKAVSVLCHESTNNRNTELKPSKI